jgi:hypothetical protein
VPKYKKGTAGHVAHSILIERYEAKYIIPPSLVPKIRDFIEPFCVPDPNGEGDPPEYVILTLQLDSPDLCLHHAKDFEALNRFKLRVRTYGLDGKAPIFIEIKRKIKRTIVKSRAMIPRDKWCEELIMDPDHKHDIEFKSDREETALLEFIRLSREIGARPVVTIRYNRESYLSRIDQYARVTFDRRLLYQPTKDWTSFGLGGRWRPIDTPLIQNKANSFSGVILELKSLSDVPLWVVEVTERFGLAQQGHCKYSNALWQEGFFLGQPEPPMFANELFLP